MASDAVSNSDKPCWVTLVTKASYLPGVVILAHTLDKHDSKYPFIVQYTSSLGDEAIAALKVEGDRHRRIVPMHVELLLPRSGQENTGSVADRFKDTFTKLRAFEVYQLGFTQAAFLDADMALFRNPDDIFSVKLPTREWIGANHACCCNLDKDAWAPADWNKYNCPYTSLRSPGDVVPIMSAGVQQTYRNLNGGLFMFFPTDELWQRMLDFFNTTDRLKLYQFPDQEFLAEFFHDHWQPMSWKYNAIKTMRYWHPRVWSDKDLVVLHYIVDKPWERSVGPDGIAGHLGRDGVSHQWWWDYYEEWLYLRSESEDDRVVVDAVKNLVGKEKPFTKFVPLPEEPGKPDDAVSGIEEP